MAPRAAQGDILVGAHGAVLGAGRYIDGALGNILMAPSAAQGDILTGHMVLYCRGRRRYIDRGTG
jgi:hypothetical protein